MVALLIHMIFATIPSLFSGFPDRWVGQVNAFSPTVIEGDIGLNQIRDIGGGSNRIALSTGIFYGVWQFSVIFDDFATSNQNRAWVWLAVDDPEQPVGYAVRIGENGSLKRVRLFEMRGSAPPREILVSSAEMLGTTRQVDLVVDLSPDGNVVLGVSLDNGPWHSDSTIYQPETLITNAFTGIHTVFTSTRTERFRLGPASIRKHPLYPVKAESKNPTTVQIGFSEPLPSDFVKFVELESVDGKYPTTMHVKGRDLILEYAAPLSGGTHNLTIHSYRDPVTGSRLGPVELTVKVTEPAELFDVVINELTPRPANNHEPYFLELFNRSQKTLDLSGWRVGRQNQSVEITSGSGTPIIRPGEYMVIGKNLSDIPHYEGSIVIHANLPTFAKTQDQVWVRDRNGNLIDSLRYDSRFSHALRDGYSMERLDPDYATMDPDNWKISAVNSTPGRQNSVHETFDVAGAILSAVADSSSLLVTFSRFINLNSNSRFIVNGEQVTSYEWNPWNGNMVLLRNSNLDWINRINVTLHAENIDLDHTSPSASIHAPVLHPPLPGSLQINEIMYQPLQNRYSIYSDQSEYVEFKNMTSYPISLGKVYLRDGTDKHGQFRSWVPVNPHWQVEPQGYAVIFADTANIFDQTRLSGFFGIKNSTALARVDRSTLGLNVTGREVLIGYKNNIVIDSVYYDPDWHSPFVRDPRGISLERYESPDPGFTMHWSSSNDPLGGTPGMPNTNRVRTSEDEHEELISLDPNPFSPDSDGHDDLINIKVRLKEPGYMIRLRIFNQRGFLVRDLTGDVLSGNIYTTWWDGKDRQGRLLPTGIYILHVEGRHHAGHPPINQKKLIVLARRR